ncbi:hypothetical protein FDP41_012255 [Naegleria fowleri]|uniref:Large ribosomal subunit protein uL29m n=1 Tax=Naegleria fowleri TaxID=5763 RepID=A0A6A5C767_NAEFO|nr:uncharacterized protein FDP41_012255 [Naegleria fowleri]KAF0981598.1 hypothetical protein FDP41_012255 [Naegleria fowleri]CAG4715853.1 unnamed protein product [Naegleria fowleri]
MFSQIGKVFRGSTSSSVMSLMRKTQPKRGLEEFIDKTILEGKAMESCGRAWGIRELRIKSLSDLQKLWIVLMKERNMLLTARLLAKTMGGRVTHPERLVKVRTGMARIKRVIAEREREAREAAKIEFEKRKAKGYYSYPQVNPLGLQTSSESSTTQEAPSSQ